MTTSRVTNAEINNTIRDLAVAIARVEERLVTMQQRAAEHAAAIDVRVVTLETDVRALKEAPVARIVHANASRHRLLIDALKSAASAAGGAAAVLLVNHPPHSL